MVPGAVAVAAQGRIGAAKMCSCCCVTQKHTAHLGRPPKQTLLRTANGSRRRASGQAGRLLAWDIMQH
jgi:hypothetical protein